jgi:nucleotide-binding universal stress UspA family protein
LAEEKSVHASPKVVAGIPWQEICRYVQSEGYDIVVAGARDTALGGRMFVGSTGMMLLRYCEAPVWVTPPGTRNNQLDILVPTDFSVHSLDALRLAAEFSRFNPACVHLLHVLDPSLALPTWYSRVTPQMRNEYIAQQYSRTTKKLEDQITEAGELPIGLKVRVHIVEGAPDESILKAMDALDVNLIVMGTAARFGSGRCVLSDTTERLLLHTRCSLIVIKPQGIHCSLPFGSSVVGRRTALGTSLPDDRTRVGPQTRRSAASCS